MLLCYLKEEKKVLSVTNAPKNWDSSSLNVSSAKASEPAPNVMRVETGKGETMFMKER